MSKNIQYSCEACRDIYTSRNTANTCCTPFAINELQEAYLVIPGVDSVSSVVIPIDNADKFVYQKFGLSGRNLGYIPYYRPMTKSKE